MSSVWKLSIAILLMLPAFASGKEEKPKSLEEAKAAFVKADKALNEAWAAAKKALAEPDFAELQIKQRDWMKFREDRARGATRDAGQPETKLTAAYYEAATEVTTSRADWLRGRIKNDDESLTGLWSDSFGGTLEIVQEKERLLFEISVVRGPTYHTGSLAGVATWNTPLGWFSDKGRDKEKTEESNLAFVARGTVLEIIGANTGYYHGARAYFDGEYCKVGQLDEKRKSDVTKAAESGAIPEEK
ncbi:MAG: lysozyme inhibitor LprI family protein [Chthoniobacterales bacterium]